VDCGTGDIVAYAHGVSAVPYAYAGGFYSPSNNRIYFCPLDQSSETNWHYIQEYSNARVSPALMAGPCFNKT
jgi:hypothetical protein